MGHSSGGHDIFILWLKLPGRSHAAGSHQEGHGAGWISGWESGEYLVLVSRLVGQDSFWSEAVAGQQSLPCRGGDFLDKEERGAGPVYLMSFYDKVTYLFDPGKPVLGFGKAFDTAFYGTLLDKMSSIQLAKCTIRWVNNWLVGQAPRVLVNRVSSVTSH